MSEQSRHCYPGTDVLINLADLRTQRQLDELETLVARRRLAELQLRPLAGGVDLRHCRHQPREFGDSVSANHVHSGGILAPVPARWPGCCPS